MSCTFINDISCVRFTTTACTGPGSFSWHGLTIFLELFTCHFIFLHPRVFGNIFVGGSLSRIGWNHPWNQVFEFWTEMTCFIICLVLLPKTLRISLEERTIARIGSLSFEKWYVFGAHNEQNATKREKVCWKCLILGIGPYLRSHILWCSQSRCWKSLLRCATEGTRETKVSYLYVKVLIKQAILWLKISMCNVLLMHKSQCGNNLHEKVLAYCLVHKITVHN